MNIPYSVSVCLYAGISAKIDFLKNTYIDMIQSESGERKEAGIKVIDGYFEDIKQALDFYTEHCVLSAVHLKSEFRFLEEKMKLIERKEPKP